MKKIVSRANTPEFNANYDRVFKTELPEIELPKAHLSPIQKKYFGIKDTDPTKKDRLANLNKSLELMKHSKRRNGRF